MPSTSTSSPFRVTSVTLPDKSLPSSSSPTPLQRPRSALASSSPSSVTAKPSSPTKWTSSNGNRLSIVTDSRGLPMSSPGYFLSHLWLIPLFPLASATIMFFFGRRMSKESVNLFCVGSVFLSFLHALGAVLKLLYLPASERVYQQIIFRWVTPGAMPTSTGIVNFVADWGYLLDPLSCVMIIVVTFVGFLIHVYSIGYMAHEGGYYRFFGYLNLFLFAMLTLVLANNLLLLFVGWEVAGLCSYLLIGFYFLKKSAADAGKKAFIVNSIGDAGFLLGLLLVAATFGTARFTSQGLTDPAAVPAILQSLAALVGQPQFT